MYIKSIYCTIFYLILISRVSRVNSISSFNIQDDDDDDDVHRPITRSPKRVASSGYEPQKSNSHPKLVEVDVNNKESTKDIDYQRDETRNRDRFTAKSGCLINKVLKGSKVMFEPPKERLINRVIIYVDKENKKRCKFLEPDHEEVFEDEAQPSTPTKTSQTETTSGPVLIDVNLKLLESTEHINYKYYQNEDIHKFTCKEGYLIGKINKGDRVITTYNKDYPNRVLILKDENNKPFMRALAPGQKDSYEPVDSQESQKVPKKQHTVIHEAPVLKTPPQKTGPSGVQIIELDLNNRETNDQYIYEKNDAKQYERFTCKPGFLISKVMKKEKVAAEAKDNKYFNRAVVSVTDGQKNLTALLPENIDETAEKIEIDVNEKETNDRYIYKYNAEADIEKFTCKSGFLIKKVLKNGNLVVKSPDDDYYDRAIIYKDDQGKKQLTTLFPGEIDKNDKEEPTAIHSIVALMHKQTPELTPIEVQKETPEVTRREVHTTHPKVAQKVTPDVTSKVSPKSFQITVSEPGDDEGPQKQPTVVRPVTEPQEVKDPSTRIGIRLNLKVQENTEEYKYRKSGYINTYTANDDYGFKMVRIDKLCIWENNDPKKYGKRVDYSTNKFTKISEIRIDLYDFTSTKFTSEDGEKWQEGKVIALQPITLNIKKRQETEQFDNKTNGDFRNFMAKSGWGFNCIIEHGMFGDHMALGSPVPIWQADDRNEYAIKVIRDGAKLTDKINTMSIYLVNGEEIHYYKSGGTWAKSISKQN